MMEKRMNAKVILCFEWRLWKLISYACSFDLCVFIISCASLLTLKSHRIRSSYRFYSVIELSPITTVQLHDDQKGLPALRELLSWKFADSTHTLNSFIHCTRFHFDFFLLCKRNSTHWNWIILLVSSLFSERAIFCVMTWFNSWNPMNVPVPMCVRCTNQLNFYFILL